MVGNLFLSPEESVIEILNRLGSIGKWLQAIGIIVILWVVFQIVQFVYNRRRVKRLDRIEEKLKSIEKKLDKIVKKRIDPNKF